MKPRCFYYREYIADFRKKKVKNNTLYLKTLETPTFNGFNPSLYGGGILVSFLETFVPNLVSLTRLSLQILGKTHTGVFPISGFLVNPLYKKLVITTEPVMILT